jgi:hypothetical protein
MRQKSLTGIIGVEGVRDYRTPASSVFGSVHDATVGIIDDGHAVPEEIAANDPSVSAKDQAEHHLKHRRKNARGDNDSPSTDLSANAPYVGLEFTETWIEVAALSNRSESLYDVSRHV